MPYLRNYQTFLRVFEPLSVHPELESQTIEDNREEVLERLGADADRRLISLPIDPVPRAGRSDYMFLPGEAVGDGVDRVCPAQEDVRGWHTLEVLLENLNSRAIDLVVPKPARRRASRERALWLQQDPDVRVFTRTATWEVPAEWLVAVVAEEDDVVIGDTVVVRTPILTAAARAEWAADILDREAPNNAITISMRELSDWLDQFDLGSIVELDYAGLTPLVWPDDSSTLVHGWVEAVDDKDEARAQQCLADFVDTWAPASALSRGS